MSERDLNQGDGLLRQIHDTLAEAGIHVLAERDGKTIVLSGEVDSPVNREAALDVARAVADRVGLRVDDALDVIPEAPADATADTEIVGAGDFKYLDADRDDNLRLDAGFELDPDFTGEIGTTDSMAAAAEAIPYFPPTDPVVRPSDDDISGDVLRELREDALTTDLVIQVVTRHGVVHLRGEVPSLEDAENAEAVASRVDGVKEVREELDIPSLQGSTER